MIEGCPRRRKARGLCPVHYQDVRAAGRLDRYPTLDHEHRGLHTAREVVQSTGISYRMLDHWCNRGVLGATHTAVGSGDHRRFSDADIAGIRAVIAEWNAAEEMRRRVQSGATFREAANRYVEASRTAEELV